MDRKDFLEECDYNDYDDEQDSLSCFHYPERCQFCKDIMCPYNTNY